MLDFFISIWSESYQAPHCQKLLCPSCTCELKGLFNKSTPCNYPDVRFSLFLCNFKTNPLKRDFPWSGGPERYPDWNSDIKLKVRKYSDFGFRNISLKLISAISFINIGKPTFPGSGTLPQTMTLESFFFFLGLNNLKGISSNSNFLSDERSLFSLSRCRSTCNKNEKHHIPIELCKFGWTYSCAMIQFDLNQNWLNWEKISEKLQGQLVLGVTPAHLIVKVSELDGAVNVGELFYKSFGSDGIENVIWKYHFAFLQSPFNYSKSLCLKNAL